MCPYESIMSKIGTATQLVKVNIRQLHLQNTKNGQSSHCVHELLRRRNVEPRHGTVKQHKKNLQRDTPRGKADSRYPGSGFPSPTRGRTSSILVKNQRSVRTNSTIRNSPSVQLGRAEYDDPIVSRRVVGSELHEDVAAQGSSAEDGQQFERDDGRICNAPSVIGTCVFFPWVCVTF